MNKRDLSNTSFAFNLGSTTFLCDYKYSIPNLNMNIIILTFCYFIYCVLICVYIYISYFLHCIYSLYQFVNEKVENQIKSNQIKSNQIM